MGWDFSLTSALNVMRRTAPFVFFRMAVYFGIAILYIVATGGGGGIGYAVTAIGDGEGVGALYGAIFGFAGASGVLYWAREYVLYIVKAGHIAVMTKMYDQQPFPEGKGQIAFAKDIVTDRFAEANILFGVDQLVKGVLKVITGTLNTVANFIPIPGLNNLVKMFNAVVKMSLTYVDEIMLAHLIRTDAENPWKESQRALILYAQNYRSMLKNAVWLSLMMWALTIIVFVVMLAPAAAVVALYPGEAGFWGVVIAFIFAWSAKAALIEPVAIYSLMQVYFKKIEGQEPDPEWEKRLDKASKHFRELKEKALAMVPTAKETPKVANDEEIITKA